MRRVGYLVVWMLMAFLCASARAAVEGFEESFDGNGPFSTKRGVSISGLDNPGWGLFIDEYAGSFDGSGYAFDIQAPIEVGIPSEFNAWERVLTGHGSFRETVRISDVEAGWYNSGSAGGDIRNAIQLIHAFKFEHLIQVLNIPFDTDIMPELNNKLIWYSPGVSVDLLRVPNETLDIEFGLEYDRRTGDTWYFLDSPKTGRVVTGPYHQPMPEVPESLVSLSIASGRDGTISGRLDNWSLEPLPDIRADINDDGVLNLADVDLLSLIIRRSGTDAVADLSIDGKVDQTDLALWIHDHRKTYFGDANLDGQFNSTDLVQVYQAGKFETGQTAGWAEGDWDPNGVFDSSDLVAAFHDGGYEAGPRQAMNAVPEPTGFAVMIPGLLVAARSTDRSRRKCIAHASVNHLASSKKSHLR